MIGELSQQPLAELVREISQKGLSGTLRLQHEQGKVAVYFEDGQLIYAASNLRELRISEYLKRKGVLSEQQLTSLAGGRSDASLIAALTASGGVDLVAIESLVAKQVGDVLRVGLLWSNGKWEFDDRAHLGDPVKVQLDVAGLLLQTARKMDDRFVASRFPSPDEVISPVPGTPAFDTLLPAEGFVLSRVDVPITLGDLLSLSGQPEAEALKTIYALALGGFIDRQRWPVALKVDGVRIAKSPAVRVEKKDEAVPSQPEPSAESEMDDLNAFLNKLDDAATHYEVLGISSGAPSDEIKTSYYALARRYHPDRFHLVTSTLMNARIDSAFARIAQAYETLMDPSRRTGYDAKLAALEKSRKYAESAPKASRESSGGAQEKQGGSQSGRDVDRAEDNFKQGYAALQQGQTKLAITTLAAAARIVPNEPRYRAYYGRALAMSPDTRRLAEAELQAAIRLDSSNVAYRVMLAELCYDLGFFKRAEGELERAISYEPNNPAAQKLMRKLEAARAAK